MRSMTCASCGSANAVENCYRCEAWVCEDCAQEYDGYYLCQVCFAEVTGDSFEDLDDEDETDLEQREPEPVEEEEEDYR
ncbi:MAG: hypothetical protein EHM19_04140 [Candidatus Latescibacterota bacterium]|nr:MAG: hypothetical protein EHM19_04140 [Candidatus Latescibacterota bacterium]